VNCRSKIRVDLVVYDYPDAVSGPISWALRMPLILQGLGFSIRVLSFYWGESGAGVLARSLQSQGIPLLSQPFGSTEQNTCFLLHAVASDVPDVFIANHVVPALLLSGWLRRQGIPTVGVLRSDDVFYHGVIDSFVSGRAYDRLSQVVCVSQFLAQAVANKNRRMPVLTIPSGTPLPEELAQPSDTLRLIYSGRLVQEQKRIKETVDAMILACQKIDGVQAVILGEGPERHRLEARVGESGADVRFAGRLPVAEMLQELQKAHVIVLLSDYEGLPGSIVEGMACGLVPVCMNIRSGLTELIADGVNGFLVADRGQQFIDAIRLLRSSTDLWQRLSKAARLTVEQDFSLESGGWKWAGLIRRLAATNSFRGPLKVPRSLDLAPLHPALAAEDHRVSRVSNLQQLYQLTRSALGNLLKGVRNQ
jgi:colanic acid/amylovoran biosynthesis glycosyltransferase